MKIKAETLRSFVEKVSIGGEISTLIIEGINDGFICKVMALDNARATIGTLKASAFTNYQTDLKLCIKDSKELIDTLRVFKGEVSIIVGNGELKLFDDEQDATLPMAAEEFIENKLPPVFEQKAIFDGGINISEKFNDMISKQISLLASDKTILIVKNKIMETHSKGKTQNKMVVKIPVDYKDVTTTINSQLYSKVLNVLSGNINYSVIGDNSLLQLKESNEHMTVRIIIAPIVEDG
jgi:hypothetical protein